MQQLEVCKILQWRPVQDKLDTPVLTKDWLLLVNTTPLPMLACSGRGVMLSTSINSLLVKSLLKSPVSTCAFCKGYTQIHKRNFCRPCGVWSWDSGDHSAVCFRYNVLTARIMQTLLQTSVRLQSSYGMHSLQSTEWLHIAPSQTLLGGMHLECHLCCSTTG